MNDLIHLKAPRGWINDPNGFIYYNGSYHLFYQHFPYAPKWGRMHWGHAVSADLVHWEHRDIALYPSKKDDRSGCFSGSAVEHEGRLYLYYTGVSYAEEDPENINLCLNDDFTAAQLMMTSEDGFRFDNLGDKRRIIPPIEDKSIGCRQHTRDPKVWRGKDAWYMVLGSTVGGNGRLLIYRSDDLVSWSFVNHTDREGLGWMWECPDYFEVGGQGLLVFSPIGLLNGEKQYDAATICMLAKFSEADCSMSLEDEYVFFDYGIDLYAPQSTTDAEGRRVIIAWARMPEPMDEGRSGMLCMPRVVEVKNHHIYFRPHPNVAARFSEKISDVSEAGKGGYRVSLTLKNGESINVGGYVIARDSNKITADRSRVFAGHEEIRCQFETPEIKEGDRLDIYVDKNLIEVYINDGEYVLSNTVYGLSGEIQAADFELYTTNE